MGTITDKLYWLYNKRYSIINELSKKLTRQGSSALDSGMSLATLANIYTTWPRKRLVPVLVMYMPYSYGTYNGVTAYYPLRYYNSPYTWVDNIVDPTYSVIDDTDIRWMGSEAPVLTRSEKGVITGTLPNPSINYDYLFPFVLAGGIWDTVADSLSWQKSPTYASMSYYYPSSRSFKVLIADDHTKNDGIFILGAIALVDPLDVSFLNSYALPHVNTYIVNTSYINSGNYNQGFSTLTAIRLETGRYSLTIPYGYNTYDKIFPIITGASSSGNAMEASIKNFTVYSTSSTLAITTGNDADRSDAGFYLSIFAYKNV